MTELFTFNTIHVIVELFEDLSYLFTIHYLGCYYKKLFAIVKIWIV